VQAFLMRRHGAAALCCVARDLAVSTLHLRNVQACARQGGERFSLAPGATARSLKKQFQALAIPAWQRDGPLLYSCEGRLIFVPGLGVEARFQAPAGQPQLRLSWVPAAAESPTAHRQHPG
jgi:tRNA(Ile)-lysidine synthase